MAPYIWIKSNIYQGKFECFIESIENGACYSLRQPSLIPVRFRLITCTSSSLREYVHKGLLADSYIMRSP